MIGGMASSSSVRPLPSRAVLLVMAALVFFVVPGVLSLAVDWLWFAEVGHLPVLTQTLSVQALLGMVLMQLELAGIVDPGTVPSPVDHPPS